MVGCAHQGVHFGTVLTAERARASQREHEAAFEPDEPSRGDPYACRGSPKQEHEPPPRQHDVIVADSVSWGERSELAVRRQTTTADYRTAKRLGRYFSIRSRQ